MLMDRETLNAHRSQWVTERTQYCGALDRLTESERTLFRELIENRLGECIRLEQERVGFGWLERALGELDFPEAPGDQSASCSTER